MMLFFLMPIIGLAAFALHLHNEVFTRRGP